ncbi:hypothetical protein LTR86_009218 [Recurvomyces mirabilis]|nr:hypothetical protein LTR86_009218 [Recurvomyces mirabilis]
MDEAKQEHKRLLSGPTVEIIVGKERKKWCLHKNLLCHHSSYFEVEFDGHELPKKKTNGMDEGGSEKALRLELPDEDPQGFELFVKWLYQGKLEQPLDMEDEEAHYSQAVSCQKFHRLCEKFSLLHLANLSMDAYRLSLNTAQLVPDAEEINEIYRSSAPGSPFRKLMTRIAARQIMDPDVDKDAESYRCCFEGNTDFAVEMVNAIRSMSGGMLFEDPTTDVVDEDGEVEGDGPCEYHDHSDGSRCAGGPSPVKVKMKPVVKTLVNGNGATPSVVRHPIVQLLPVELSAERRTPRKLNVEPPRTPTPKGGASRKAPASTNGQSAVQPRKPSSTVPKKKPQQLVNGNGTSHSQPQVKTQLLTNGNLHIQLQTPTRPSGPSLDSRSSASGPRKLARTPAKQVNGTMNGTSVLGKRRATEGAPAGGVKQGAANGVDGATLRKASQGVNGFVQHWNGMNGEQSDGGTDMAFRKIAPKLKRTQAL